MARSAPASIVFSLLLAGRVCATDFDLATSINQVGLDLYRQLAAGASAGNLALSPYSIESGLALAYAGADGKTRTEMARVLHFPSDDQPLRAAFVSLRGSLDQIVAESAQAEKQREKMGGQGDVIEWRTANRLFGQTGYDFRSSFLELLKGGYGAHFEAVDFKNHPEKERLRINVWVAAQTEKKILNLIPDGGVSAATRLALVNALYLKAPWARRFAKEATSDLPFYPGRTKFEAVPTMRKTSKLGYLNEDGYTAVALPYQGGNLQLLILLPDDRVGLGPLTAKLTPALFRACAKIGPPRLVALYLPRFRLEGSTIRLVRALEALGMKTAFDRPPGSADFDRAAPRKPNDYLALSEVFHRVLIAVDEEGTEAAAATAAGMLLGFAVDTHSSKPIEVHVDHPFFFAVQHRASGACLFLGAWLIRGEAFRTKPKAQRSRRSSTSGRGLVLN